MQRKILIADDNKMNRFVLGNILSDKYEIIEAPNGKVAMEKLEQNYKEVSAVLLDIVMPEIDGYEVLRRINSVEAFRQIPVLVTTASVDEKAESKALTLGAIDFITKPFNAQTVRQRVSNLIRLRETSAVVNAAKYDRLTGLYSRQAFFDAAEDMISLHENGYYVLACLDIDKFKVINDRYGTTKGDEVLKLTARILDENFSKVGGICARLTGDDFAVLYPKSFMDKGSLAILEKLKNSDGSLKIDVSIGRYVVDDLTVPVSGMYDRATLALNSIKGRFDKQTAIFDESMRTQLLAEKEISSEMKSALDKGQFKVWLQPQYNHTTGSLIGAEALVRWIHPVKGLISPANFIPVFERNGFIYELDRYVWEQSCILLRTWLDKGFSPLPISVNVSRYDALRKDFTEIILSIVSKYNIPVELFRIEITESAFSESSAEIFEVVKNLIGNGFTVEIDDFGSGYSSLNTLKDVPAQILKLDMRFFEQNDDSDRSGNIVESVVRMAKWLGMAVIAEGVETKMQADYLSSIGCCYVQGFLYARPMTAENYENLFRHGNKEEKLLTLETVDNLDSGKLWNPESLDSLIFNYFVGAACIAEYRCERLELIRINEKFVKLFESDKLTTEKLLKLTWSEYLDEVQKSVFREAVIQSLENKDVVTRELVFDCLPDCGEKTYLKISLRVFASVGDRVLIFFACENVTSQKLAEEGMHTAVDELYSTLNDIPCAFVRLKLNPDNTTITEFVNDNFCVLRGLDRKEIMESDSRSVINDVHPDDVKKVRSEILKLKMGDETINIRYRLKYSDNDYHPVSLFGRVTCDPDGNRHLNVYYAELTDEEKQEYTLKDTIPYVLSAIMNSSRGIAFAKDKNLRYICCSSDFANLTGADNEKDVVGKNDYELFPSEVADLSSSDDKKLLETGNSLIDYIEAIPTHDGVQRFFNVSKYVVRDSLGQVVGIYGNGREITEEREAYARLKLLTNSIPGGIATYVGTRERQKLIYFNDGLCNMLGYTREEYEKKCEESITGCVFSEDLPKIREQIERLIDTNTPINYTYRVVTKNGNLQWVNLRGVISERHDDRFLFNAVLFDVTESIEKENKLRLSEQRFRIASRIGGRDVAQYDIKSKVLYHSSQMLFDLGFESEIANFPKAMIEKQYILPESRDEFLKFYDKLEHGEENCTVDFAFRVVDDKYRWFRNEATVISDNYGNPLQAIIVLTDITQQREKEAAFNKFRQSLKIRRADSYTYIRWNLNKERFDYSAEGTLIDYSFDRKNVLFNQCMEEYAHLKIVDEDRDRFIYFVKSERLISEFMKGKVQQVLEYRESKGINKRSWRKINIEMAKHPFSEDIEAYIMFEDIDEQKKATLRTLELAQRDPLTGVYNRTTFVSKMNSVLALNDCANHALLMMDIDGFKQLNDSLGHAAGDKALIDLTRSLKSVLRKDDIIGRLGGDEFLVFLGNISCGSSMEKKAKQICAALHKDYKEGAKLSASIGIALYPYDGRSFSELYRCADMALYKVKNSGKDNFSFYESIDA